MHPLYPFITYLTLDSETQLRSRLKKWRVTKTFRRTRKGIQGQIPGNNQSEEDQKRIRATPQNDKSPAAATGTATTGWDGPSLPVSALLDFQPHPIDQRWNTSLAGRLTSNHFMEHRCYPDRFHTVRDSLESNPPFSPFEGPAWTSPATEGLNMNTTPGMMPPCARQPVHPGPQMCSPETTMVDWPPCTVPPNQELSSTVYPGGWYPMPFEASTSPPDLSHSKPVGTFASQHRELFPIAKPLSPMAYSPEPHNFRVYEHKHRMCSLSPHHENHGWLKPKQNGSLPALPVFC